MIQRLQHGEIEGLRVGRFGSAVNTHCILYRLGETVIDTGPPNQWPRVRRFLGERRVYRVVVTHHHEDHSGNLGPIHQATGAEIRVPAAGVARVRDGFPLRLYQKLVWGRPDRVVSEPVPETVDLGGGRTLRAVASPGHSTDMTCYLVPEEGWLFTGDLYITRRPRYLRSDEDLAAQMESLRRILRLDFGTVLCSHRGVVDEGREALGGKLVYLEELCGKVGRLRDEGRDEGAIARALVGREDFMSRLTGMHFSKRNLVRACLRALDETR